MTSKLRRHSITPCAAARTHTQHGPGRAKAGGKLLCCRPLLVQGVVGSGGKVKHSHAPLRSEPVSLSQAMSFVRRPACVHRSAGSTTGRASHRAQRLTPQERVQGGDASSRQISNAIHLPCSLSPGRRACYATLTGPQCGSTRLSASSCLQPFTRALCRDAGMAVCTLRCERAACRRGAPATISEGSMLQHRCRKGSL